MNPYSLTPRQTKGSALTHQELDDNFSYLDYKIDNFTASASTETVFSGLTANNSTSSTTSLLRYGINIFDTVTMSDFATKLPQPITGKSVMVVNKGSANLHVFPSNTGGYINDLTVDSPAVIPNDGNLYTFFCVENPLPGAWVISLPATNQIELLEITVSHTNGIQTFGCGVGNPLSGFTVSAIGSGISGGNLTLTPSSAFWDSLNSVSTSAKLKCYTNILPADMTSTSTSNSIYVARYQAYKTSASASTSGIREQIYFIKDGDTTFFPGVTLNFTNGGVLNSPVEVGDAGTMYGEIVIDYSSLSQITGQLGLGGTYSRYYFTVGILVPSTAATKDYKFRIFFEYF